MGEGTVSAELRWREQGRPGRGKEMKIRTKAKRRPQKETDVMEIGDRRSIKAGRAGPVRMERS